MTSYVYILASNMIGTIYVSVTADLIQRVSQHKEGTFKGLNSRYKVHKLVWYETHEDSTVAIQREKQLKK